jgi:hypothetical protein
MLVIRQERQIVLQNDRGYPKIIRRNGRNLPQFVCASALTTPELQALVGAHITAYKDALRKACGDFH